jgi:hypothetical protein
LRISAAVLLLASNVSACETEIQAGKEPCGTDHQGHLPRDTAEVCRREGIVENLYYRWSKDFLEAGKKRLGGDPCQHRSKSRPSRRSKTRPVFGWA